MKVNYNVTHVKKGNKVISENDLKNIITEKLLRVILSEEEISIALNNS